MSEHGDSSPEPEEPARAEAPAPAVPMQILGRLEEFDPTTDSSDRQTFKVTDLLP